MSERAHHQPRIKMKPLLPLIVIVAIATSVFAQEQKPATPKEPKTKLEAFEAKTGAVIIRGFSRVGTVRGQYGTTAEVVCNVFTDASSGKKEYGVSITTKQTSQFERKDSAYIDYDEIDSLIKGIDYIIKIEKGVTKLDQFQADYKTRAELLVSTYSDSSGKVNAAVQTGRFSPVTVFLSLDDLGQFKSLMQQAKTKIDEIRQ